MSGQRLGLIGGTGLGDWDALDAREARHVSTRWGEPSGALCLGRVDGQPVCFLARHGAGHRIPPHRINYRANLQALYDVGVREVIAVAAVGAMDPRLPPGAIAIPDDIIDYTWGRAHTYSDDAVEVLRHVEFTHPYHPGLRERLLRAAERAGVDCVAQGVMGVSQGPRLESAAEVQRMIRDGCTMVGMTAMPEAALAAELGMAYAGIAVSVNWAAGVGDGDIHGEIERSLAEGMGRAKAVIRALLQDPVRLGGGAQGLA